MTSRRLTVGEIALLRNAFGIRFDALGVSEVEVYNAAAIFFLRNYNHSDGKNVYFPPGVKAVPPNGSLPSYSDDFSKVAGRLRPGVNGAYVYDEEYFVVRTFIHEIAHVLQAKYARMLMLERAIEGVGDQRPDKYGYTAAYQYLNQDVAGPIASFATQRFGDLHFEAQASIIADYAMLKLGYGLPPLPSGKRRPSEEEYKRYLKELNLTVEDFRQLPAGPQVIRPGRDEVMPWAAANSGFEGDNINDLLRHLAIQQSSSPEESEGIATALASRAKKNNRLEGSSFEGDVTSSVSELSWDEVASKGLAAGLQGALAEIVSIGISQIAGGNVALSLALQAIPGKLVTSVGSAAINSLFGQPNGLESLTPEGLVTDLASGVAGTLVSFGTSRLSGLIVEQLGLEGPVGNLAARVLNVGFSTVTNYALGHVGASLGISGFFGSGPSTLVIDGPLGAIGTMEGAIAGPQFGAGFGASLGGAIGSWAGSALSAAVFGSSIGQSIGSAIGGAIGTALGSSSAVLAALGIPLMFNPITALIGAFIFAFIGGALGSLFGGGAPPKPDPIWTSAAIEFDRDEGQFKVGASYTDHRHNKDNALAIANGAANELNGLIGTIGGQIAGLNFGNLVMGEYIDFKQTYYNSPWIPKPTEYYYRIGGNSMVQSATFGPTLMVEAAIGAGGNFYFSDSGAVLTTGVLNILSQMKFAGGDPYFKRLIEHIKDNFTGYQSGLPAGEGALDRLRQDLGYAADYGLYLDNPEAFLAELTNASIETRMRWEAARDRIAALGLDRAAAADGTNGLYATTDQYERALLRHEWFGTLQDEKNVLRDATLAERELASAEWQVTSGQPTGGRQHVSFADPGQGWTMGLMALDLAGDGLKTIAAEDSQIRFDIDNDGYLEQTSWLEGSDGFLVFDRNLNGVIDDVSEMFSWAYGSSRPAHETGPRSLASLDSNGDRIIDARDRDWDSIRVWADQDADGETDFGEMHALWRFNIKSIDLDGNYGRGVIDGDWLIARPRIISYTDVVPQTYDLMLDYDPFGVRAVDTEFGVRVEAEGEDISLTLDADVIHGTINADLLVGTKSTITSVYDEENSETGDDIISGDGGLDTFYGGGDVDKTYAVPGHTWNGGGSGNDVFLIDIEAKDEDGTVVSTTTSGWQAYGGDGDDSVVFRGTVGVSYALDTATETSQLLTPPAQPAGMSNADYAQLVASYPRTVEKRWGIEAAYGGDGNDTLSTTNWTTGNVTMAGNAGEDLLVGGIGHDRLDGGADSDRIYGGGGNDLIDGGAGHDLIWGGDGDDIIVAETADPYTELAPGSAPIFIDGGAGRDVLKLAGNDRVIVNITAIGIETIVSGNGNDTLSASGQVDVFIGGGIGDDTIFGSDGDDTLEGGAGRDRMFGGAGDDTIAMDAEDFGILKPGDASLGQFMYDQGGGQTTSSYRPQTDRFVVYWDEVASLDYFNVDGVFHYDEIRRLGTYGSVFNIDGNYWHAHGNPVVSNDADTVVLYHSWEGPGGYFTPMEWYTPGPFMEEFLVDYTRYFPFAGVIDGGVGFDRLVIQGDIGVPIDAGVASFEMITGGGGNDHIYTTVDAEIMLFGEGGDDTLSGNGHDDLLNGGDGDDTLIGNGGNDTIGGGAGSDVVSYAYVSTPLIVTLAPEIAEGTPAGTYVLAGTTIAWTGDTDRTTISVSASDIDVVSDVEAIIGGSGNDTLVGTSEADTFTDGQGTDTVYGGHWRPVTTIGADGNDTISTLYGGGDDVFYSSDGHVLDTFYGGDGDDTISYERFGDTQAVIIHLETATQSVNTGSSADILYDIESAIGSELADTIYGSDVANRLSGKGGHDLIYGGAGGDTLTGGAGNDLLYGGTNGTETIAARTIYGSGDTHTVFGAHDVDIGDTADYSKAGGTLAIDLAGGTATETIRQKRPDDMIGKRWTPTQPDTIYTDTLDGIEHVLAGDYDDTITGSAAINRIEAGAGNDTVYGGGENDTLGGGGGNDVLYGGAGNDWTGTVTVYGGSTPSSVELTLYGGDLLYGDAGTDTLYGDAGSDTLYGGSDNDTLFGGAGNDTLSGDSGDDTLIGDDGSDTLDGGVGSDTASYAAATTGLVINLAPAGDPPTDPTVAFGTGNDTIDALISIENVIGGSGDDTITGSDDSNILSGSAGDDTLTGGLGADGLRGGIGNDFYVFRPSDTTYQGDGRDVILDEGTTFSGLIDARTAENNSTIDTDTIDLTEVAAGVGLGSVSFLMSWMTPDATSAGADTIRLDMTATQAQGRLVFKLDGPDLLIGIRPSTSDTTPIENLADQIRVRDWTNPNNRVEKIAFKTTGSAYDDVWTWTTPNDGETWVLSNGVGSTTLGGATSDSYNFERGDGALSLRDSSRYTTTVNRPIETRVSFSTPDGGSGIVIHQHAFKLQNVTRYVELEGAGGNDTLSIGTTTDRVAVEDAIIRIVGTDLVIALKEGDRPFEILKDRITLRDWVNANNRVETLVFTGTTGDQTLDVSEVLARIDYSGDDVLDYSASGYDLVHTTISSGGTDTIIQVEIDAGAGNDVVYADLVDSTATSPTGVSGGNDTIIGGTGDDTLNGGAGNDTYRFGRGDGLDLVHDQAFFLQDSAVYQIVDSQPGTYTWTPSGGSERTDEYIVDFFEVSTSKAPVEGTGGTGDSIEFGPGITLADLQFRRIGNDLQIGIREAKYTSWDGLKDVITVADHFRLTGTEGYRFNAIDSLRFESGLVVPIGQFSSMIIARGTEGFLDQTVLGGAGNDWIETDEGHDILNGGNGDNWLNGGAGNDTIDGGTGTDIFVRRAGDGVDIMADSGGTDTLLVADLRDIISFAQVGSELQVGLTEGGLVRIVNQTGANPIEVLADQTIGAEYTLTSGSSGGADVVIGGSGSDTLYGGSGGSDLVSGGGGADTLYGGDGDNADYFLLGDTALSAGATDLVYGGDGADWVSFRAWHDASAAEVDRRGVSIDLSSGTVTSIRVGNETLAGLSSVENAIGSDLGDVIVAGSGETTIFAADGNDTVTGGSGIGNLYDLGAGNDTVSFSAGRSRFQGGAGNDRAVFTGSADYVFDTGLGRGYPASTTAEAGDVFVGIETFVGGTGNDLFIGDDSDNCFEGAAGSDTYSFSVGGGDDTYVDGEGANDVVRVDDLGRLADAQRQASGALVLRFTEGSVTLVDQFTGASPVFETLQQGTSGPSFGFTSAGGAGNDVLIGTDAADSVDGAAGNDLLVGGTGNDTLYGGDGDDSLIGGGGADTIYGGEGIDTVSYVGSLGGVTVRLAGTTHSSGGDAEGDLLIGVLLIGIENAIGSATSDTIEGSTGINLLYGGSGDDTLFGGGGNDTLYGGAGSDLACFDGISTALTVTLGGGAWTIAVGGETVIAHDIEGVRGGAGNDTFNAAVLAQTFDGGDGIDVLRYDLAASSTGISLRIGGAPGTGGLASGDVVKNVEVVYGTTLDDVVVGDEVRNPLETSDTLGSGLEYYAYQTVRGADNVDTYYRLSGVDETFYGGAGNDKLDGAMGNDVLDGGAGDDSLVGGLGVDTLYGGDDNDVLAGGEANDALYGGLGDDRFLIGLKQGLDSIYGGGGNDSIVVDDLANAGQIVRSGDDLVITMVDGGVVTAYGAYTSNAITKIVDAASGVEFAIAAGATTLDDVVIGTDAVESIDGLAGDDLLFGGAGNDTLYGGTGDDTLIGGAGADTFLGGSESESPGRDIVSYAGSAAAITLSRSGSTWTASGGDADGDSFDGIEGFIGSAHNDTMSGAGGNDTIADTFEGGYGDDVLLGGGGNDTLSGGEDDDRLYGGAGDDMLSGGAGNDTFFGDAGKDTLFGSDGIDLLDFSASSVGGVVVYLDIGAGVDSDADAATDNLSAGDSYSGIENVKGTSSDDRIYGDAAVNVLYGGAGADVLDGGAGDDTVLGEDGEDTLIGGFGRDTLDGGAGSDTYRYAIGDGNDAIKDAGGNDAVGDLLSLDSLSFVNNIRRVDSAGQSTLSGSGNDLLVELRDGATIRISGAFSGSGGSAGTGRIERLEDRSRDRIYRIALSGASTATGNDGDDVFAADLTPTAAGPGEMTYGGAGNDLIFGGAGNDTLYGGSGDDTLFGGEGEDWLEGGLGQDFVSYADARSGIIANLATNYVSIRGGGPTDTIVEIEALRATEFDDTIYGTSVADTLIAGAGNDLAYGNDGDDLIIGGDGADTLYGGAGNDTVSYEQSAGNVTINLSTSMVSGGQAAGDVIAGFEHAIGGRGRDTITGSATANILSGGGETDTVYGGDGDDTIDGGASDDALHGGSGYDIVSFASAGVAAVIDLAAGTASSGGDRDSFSGFEGAFGGAGNDTIYGDTQANRLEGGKGDDTLQGGTGNDIYAFRRDDEHDSILDSATRDATTGGNAGTDTLSFGAGIAVSDIYARIGTGGADTTTLQLGVLSVGASNRLFSADLPDDQIDLVSWMNTDNRIEYFAFADSTLLDLGGIASRIGTNDAEAVTWTLTAVDINVWAGDDAVTTGAYDDIVNGGDGNDMLDGGGGTDLASYVGQTTSVVATLQESGFTTVYVNGAAQDAIQNFEGFIGGSVNDTLTGNSSNNVIEGGAGADVLDGAGGSADVLSYARSNASVTVSLAANFASGGDATGDTTQGFEHVVGSQWNDTLTGSAIANVLWGGAGNDVLIGDVGGDDYADTLYGGAGDDTLQGGGSSNQIADTFYGGSGIDWISFASITAALTLDLSGSTLGGDVLFEMEAVLGGQDNDVILGTDGANIIDGSLGDDLLQAKAGNDTYRMALGGGSDAILDESAVSHHEWVHTGEYWVETGKNQGYWQETGYWNDYTTYEEAGLDTLLLVDATLDNVHISTSTSGADLIVTLRNHEDTADLGSAKLLNFFEANRRVERLQFADGVIVTIADYSRQIDTSDSLGGGSGKDWLDGREGDDVLLGREGDDVLRGGGGNDHLKGGLGNDLLAGGAGNDVYMFDRYDGADVIQLQGADSLGQPQAHDLLSFGADVDNRQIWFERVNEDLLVSIIGTTDSVTIKRWYTAGNPHHLDAIRASGLELLHSDVDTLVARMALEQKPQLGQATLSDAQLSRIYGSDSFWQAYATSVATDADDLLTAYSSGDTLDGLAGFDIVTYAASSEAVTITLTDTGDATASGGYAAGDIISDVEGLIGSAHNDTIIGNTVYNSLVGGAGNDVLDGGAGDDALYGGDGNDTLRGGAGADRLSGGAGFDYVSYSGIGGSTGVSANLATGTASGNDDAIGDQLIDIEGAEGSQFSDTFYGTTDANTFLWSAGSDTFYGGPGNDWDGDTASYATYGSGITLSVHGSGVGHSVQKASGTDYLNSIEYVVGTSQADTLSFGATNDTLEGGGGNDLLYGGGGDDTYRFGAGWGIDIIGSDSAGTDTIAFTDAAASAGDVTFAVSGSTATMTIGADSVAQTNWSTSGARVEWVTFVDGTRLWIASLSAGAVGTSGIDTLTAGTTTPSWLSGGAGADTLAGSSADDVLVGGSGNDVIVGGKGNDQLVGGAGRDTYRRGHGDGYDRIDGTGAADETDILDFGLDVQYDQLWFQRSENDLVVTVLGTADKVAVSGWYLDPGRRLSEIRVLGAHIESAEIEMLVVRMASVTMPSGVTRIPDATKVQIDRAGGWTPEEGILWRAVSDAPSTDPAYSIIDAAAGATVTGSATFDLANYSAATAAINADLSNSAYASVEGLIGSRHADILIGGSGDNWLIGGAGNDTLVGDAGADRLFGGTGIDTVSYAYASAGVTLNLATGQVAGGSSGDSGDVLFEFEGAIGSSFADTIFGNAGRNVLNGGAGDDALGGDAGDDILIGGAGADILNGGDGIDFASYAGSLSAISVVLYNGQITGGDATGDQFYSIEGVIGSDVDETMLGSGVTDFMGGGAGNDVVYGLMGNDYYYYSPGGGRDVFDDYSQEANTQWVQTGKNPWEGYWETTYTQIEGGVDTLVINQGISLSDLVPAFVGNDVLIGIKSGDTAVANLDNSMRLTRRTDALARIEHVYVADDMTSIYVPSITDVQRLSDGADTFTGGSGNDWITGEDGDDVIFGGSGANILVGGRGDDVLFGGDGAEGLVGGYGNDTMFGGGGNDAYYWSEKGQDVIDDSSGIDTLHVANGMYSSEIAYQQVGHDLRLIEIANPLNTITIRNWYTTTDARIESIQFVDRSITAAEADALSIAYATLPLPGPADTLWGTDVANLLYGDAGNDTVSGWGGNDTLYGGWGEDLLEGGTGDDILSGDDGADILRGDAGANTLYGGTGDDTLSAEAGDDVFFGGTGSDVVDYAAATGSIVASLSTGTATGAGSDVLMGIEGLVGSNANDTLSGSAGNDTLSGGNGLDTLSGDAGNDLLYGGADGDSLYGGDGNDVLYGGGGSDMLYGGAGNDRFVVGASDGSETIVDSGGTDEVEFGSGLSSDQIWLQQIGSNLVLTVLQTSVQTTLVDWYAGGGTDKIETVSASGKVLDDTGVQNLVAAMGAYTGGGGGVGSPPSSAMPGDFAALIAANWR